MLYLAKKEMHEVPTNRAWNECLYTLGFVFSATLSTALKILHSIQNRRPNPPNQMQMKSSNGMNSMMEIPIGLPKENRIIHFVPIHPATIKPLLTN
jgi:hypothetical protein